MTHDACVGVLLAGGSARRFGGQPKGLARVQGVRIADRVLAALALASTRRLVVANDPRAADWFPDHVVVADAVPGLGPLAGLATALAAAEGSAVLVVAWDMPFVTGGLLEAVRAHGERHAVSCVPVHGIARTTEPLCGYYRPEARATARTLLGRGERRAQALFDALAAIGGAVAFPEAELARHGAPDRLFLSVDSPADLGDVDGVAPDGTGPR